MSELRELQEWVARHVRSRQGLPRNEAVRAESTARLTGNERMAPVEQLEVYREQFWLRHTASLVEDFPGLGGVLGQAEWERLVESYLEKSPPEGWTLRELGRGFPEHVQSCRELSHHALCCDMARLEWLFIELFDAAEHPPLDLARLAALPPTALESGRIVLSPALRLLRASYPVADLRRDLLEARAAEPPPHVPVPAPDEQLLVLYRGPDRRLYHKPVAPEAFALLEGLGQGLSLVGACEHALEAAPDFADRLQREVGTWFQQWAKRGWIVDVIADPTPS